MKKKAAVRRVRRIDVHSHVIPESIVDHKDAFGIAGRIVVITGGNRNIGRSIALTMAKVGASPIVLFRDDDKAAQAVCEEVAKGGGRAGMYQADLADVGRLKSVVKVIEKDFGSVDILVNNAAIRPNSKISQITIEEWDLVFATNLRAPFFLTQAVLPEMIRKKWGRIINIGGMDAYWGKSRRAHGVSAKLGLVGLTRAVASEVARFGITVNVVVPGTTDTVRPHPEWYPELKDDPKNTKEIEGTALKREGTREEVANVALFLASDQSSYVTGDRIICAGGKYM